MDKKCIFYIICIFLLSFNVKAVLAKSNDEFARLERAYPESIKEITSNAIIWRDDSRTPIEGQFAILDKIINLFKKDKIENKILTREDIRKDRYESFFRKMYGDSKEEVKKKLVLIYWMPKIFGNRYPLLVTTVNGVDKKLARVIAALEKLPPSYYKYLDKPAGAFYWRKVAGQSYLSSHSFGIAIDINSYYGNYWLWDLQFLKKPFSELRYKNRIPLEIVRIFEKEGFFWGGRWYFYDTMHFEYRPELLMS